MVRSSFINVAELNIERFGFEKESKTKDKRHKTKGKSRRKAKGERQKY